MISKQQISFVRSLHQKKFRQMYGNFLVEGDKLVRELLASNFKIEAIYGLKHWNAGIERKNVTVIEVSEADLQKISTHDSPNQVVAVAEIPAVKTLDKLTPALYVACDNLSDPGNAGTIIRTADWFGIDQVFFSENSVEVFNPKVVSAAKGSLFRVQCSYVDLPTLFQVNQHLKVYGTFMNGQNIYQAKPATDAIILIGNEANGIGDELLPFVNQRIAIPNFGKAESLNAAVAAAIIISEFKRTGVNGI